MLLGALVAAACAGRPAPAAITAPIEAPYRTATVVGSVILTRPPGVAPGEAVGGLSGITRLGPSGPWLVVSDDRRAPRWFEMRFAFERGQLRVTPGAPVPVTAPPGPEGRPRPLDLEALVALPDGTRLVSSEGNSVDGRREPASVLRVTAAGGYLQTLPLPEKFLPTAPGRGLRDNLAFESLAAAPDGSRVWAIAEAPLLQDDEPAGLHRDARSRLLEWVRTPGGYRPGRELIYPISASGVPRGLGPNATLADEGPVELTRLPNGQLIVMERAFVRDREHRRAANVIRLFTIDLAGADDVSAVDALGDAPRARPIGKRLLVDLADLAPDLDPRLASLANFEGMAPGPDTPDGDPTLVLVSDDNFTDAQRMAVILLRLSK
ncbi:MAG: esterase-like activity of phytase family protein [Vicinamibacterales bacterium]